jgi:hypothetical protein
MTDIDNNKEEMLSEILGDNEFVFTEQTDENGNKQIMGGGYKVKSFFLQGGIPAFTQIKSSDKGQDGGKVSSPFDNLAVPAGIFYVNQRIPKKDRDTNDINNYYKKHESKTRRQIYKPDKRKTRRHS